ncbi:MAG: aryl-sulfate sulfotransferase [Halobacteriales archaeon]|nr:aryl-sulfate sulfotransferase [Halobacteriales archaeon]
MDPAALPRRRLARGLALAVVLLLVAPTVASGLTYDPGEATEFKRGTVTEPAEGLTVVAIQGFHFKGEGATKKPARLAAFGPRGELRWKYNGSNVGARWFYDVDPLPDGNLLVTATNPDGTIVMALDPATREPVWVERFPFTDTHDVDQLDEHRLLIGNMRAYNETTDTNNDRVLIYNRTSDEVEWEWLFREQYPELLDVDTGGGTGGVRTEDWTHVNDVDEVAPGKYLLSPRNFDQVILVDRETGEIELKLGEEGNHDILSEQHNPDYLESESGRPTFLVADSENARVVEYEHTGDGWERTWELSGGFSWPRDADRLPNGNTLVTDSLNHRVVEVTPNGEIVWEVYAPWGPYDAERVHTGGGSNGPTIADQGADGEATLHGSAGLTPGTGDRTSFAARLTATFAGTPLDGAATSFARRWAHITPWIYPVWMTGWDFALLLAALLVLLGWGLTEAVLARQELLSRARRLRG